MWFKSLGGNSCPCEMVVYEIPGRWREEEFRLALQRQAKSLTYSDVSQTECSLLPRDWIYAPTTPQPQPQYSPRFSLGDKSRR